MTPPAPPHWPYVSRRLRVLSLPNRPPFREHALWIAEADTHPPGVDPAESRAPALYYRLSARVFGRMLAAAEAKERAGLAGQGDERALQTAAAAWAVLSPLRDWLADRVRTVAAANGEPAGAGWAALWDEIREARDAPAGSAAAKLPEPAATIEEVQAIDAAARLAGGARSRQQREWLESWGREVGAA